MVRGGVWGSNSDSLAGIGLDIGLISVAGTRLASASNTVTSTSDSRRGEDGWPGEAGTGGGNPLEMAVAGAAYCLASGGTVAALALVRPVSEDDELEEDRRKEGNQRLSDDRRLNAPLLPRGMPLAVP